MTFNPIAAGAAPTDTLHCCPELLHVHPLHHELEGLDERRRMQRVAVRDMPRGWTRVEEAPARHDR